MSMLGFVTYLLENVCHGVLKALLKTNIYFFYFFSKTLKTFYITNYKVSRFQQGLTNMTLFMNAYYFFVDFLYTLSDMV
jgi:hypothetical protein